MIDWKDVGQSLAKVGLTTLGGALAGPAGATVGALVASKLGLDPGATPEQVETKARYSEESLAALSRLESEERQFLAKLAADAEKESREQDSADIAVVNETMRVEAKSEHWLQWSWRPINGYALAIGSLASTLGVMWLGYHAIATKDPGVLNMIPQLVGGIAMVLAIPGAVCGITSWHRGVLQRMQGSGK